MIALAILGNGLFGLLMDLARSPMQKINWLALHKSIGLTVLALALLRDRCGAGAIAAPPRSPRRAGSNGPPVPSTPCLYVLIVAHAAQRLVVQFDRRQAAAMVQAVQPAGAGSEKRRPSPCCPRRARIPVLVPDRWFWWRTSARH